MNKEKLIYNAIKTKAYGVNRTTRPAYGQGQYDMAYEILNMVEEIINTEHKNNGWIPCSERLPEEDSIRVYATLEHNESGYKHVRRMLYFYGRFENSNGSSVSKEFKVIAWTPERIPQPYKGE